MKEPTQFITNEKGERIAVIVSIEDYEEMIEALEDLADIRAIDEAKASNETPIPLEQALAEIERERNLK
jgi:PHD/YefM family antitoxin component YafN of YafNO toxin-antitoxin module